MAEEVEALDGTATATATPEAVAEMAKEVVEESENIESRIQRAMRSRVQHYQEQADSLTFEGVRRLLEKDLGLEKCALDVHKRFIKQRLLECLNGVDNNNASKNSEETVEQSINSSKSESMDSPGARKMKIDRKEPTSEDDQKMDDSPVMGLLTANKSAKSEILQTQNSDKKELPSESTIKKAITKRASHFRANSEKLTMAGARRLLEEDLELDKKALDSFKKLISDEVEKVLNAPKVSDAAKDVKKKSRPNNSDSKAKRMIPSKRSSDLSNSEADEAEEEVKSKKKVVPKGKIEKSEGQKKRKRPVKEAQESRKKQNKPADSTSEENSDGKDGGELSVDSQSESSAVKKKEAPTPGYGKNVEHLKSIIKSCGMSVAPSVYKRVKQAPENKREAFLVKELEEILSREGLSTNPSEKEIKEVKKRKERAKELEGIDTSNIVSSTRRRSTTSYALPPPPAKPKVPVDSDKKDDGQDAGNDDNDEDGDDEEADEQEEEEEDEDDEDDEDGDDSQSEEFNDDDDESE